MYQRVGSAAYKTDLTNTWKLASYLDHPQRSFKSVHVAGTNGKGSVSHMLASVLMEAGYKVGLYTSPHLKDFRERIKINGAMMPEQAVINFISMHQGFFEKEQLSFFEMTVGMAFDYFRKEKVDIAIVEVGLGGRLDSTNIVSPEVSVITNIGLDHTQFLGNTLGLIAREKAGIIKANVPVVIGEKHKETKSVFLSVSESLNAPVYFSEDEETELLPSDLKGNYQKQNIRTVQTTLKVLQQGGWKISPEQMEQGLLYVVKSTGLQGRWQLLKEEPMVICDTAHNKEGLSYTLKQLTQQRFDKLHIVLGVVSDKSLEHILPLFPKDAIYYFCAPQISRALKVEDLALEAAKFDLKGACYSNVREAYDAALKLASKNDLIYIGGSTFVVAEVL